MSASAPSNGSGASGGFARRAGKIVSNAGLYQLVEDLSVAVDKQAKRLDEIHSMCTRILERRT